jgi:hypothetical protein
VTDSGVEIVTASRGASVGLGTVIVEVTVVIIVWTVTRSRFVITAAAGTRDHAEGPKETGK